MSYLTIAIPTYNRATYLKECLESLYLSLPKNKADIEILVIDNHSTDNTEKIIQTFNKQLHIKYIKNKTNIGPDENFKRCISEAGSKYVWIFGDDDIFFKDSIKYILNILKENASIGLIHLKAQNFQDKNEPLDDKFNFTHIKYTSKNKFIKNVHTNITFISANIFNKSLLSDVRLKDIPNNNLGQVYWNMVSVVKSEVNIYCDTHIFGARQFNSGNYNFCEVFGKNFLDILDLTKDKYDTNSIITIIKKRLLIFYYPANIIRLKNNLSQVKYDNNCFLFLYPKFKFNIYFWIFTVPAIFLPKNLGLFIIKIIERLR